jgi:hypothetical protein
MLTYTYTLTICIFFYVLSSEDSLSESERASAIGRLGMAVGISFMVGPVIGQGLER